MTSWIPSNIPPYVFKQNDPEHKYYKLTNDGYKLAAQQPIKQGIPQNSRAERVKKMTTSPKTRKNRKSTYKKTRKNQKGGNKNGIKRQTGQRNLFNPIKPIEKKLAFDNNVKVTEYNVDRIKRKVGNSSKTRTRGLYRGTPHKINADYQQLVSSLYGKISENANTPHEMYSIIQNSFEQSNKTKQNYLVHKKLFNKLYRNYGDKSVPV